jgi:hypothetical protein
MALVFLKKPIYNAFIPPVLFFLNVLLNRLLEITRVIPGYHWAYFWGKMFSLFGILFLGCILFPIMSFSYFAHKGDFNKKKAIIYVLVAFSPVLYVVLATMLF